MRIVGVLDRPVCHDRRKCFAQILASSRNMRGDYDRLCCVLTVSTYPDGKCPFCKPSRDITDGILYPYNMKYGKA